LAKLRLAPELQFNIITCSPTLANYINIMS
jgi:hypothetical protein